MNIEESLQAEIDFWSMMLVVRQEDRDRDRETSDRIEDARRLAKQKLDLLRHRDTP